MNKIISFFKNSLTRKKKDQTVSSFISRKTDLNKLQSTISYIFKNPQLLATALTHSSCSKHKNGHSKPFEYERMEFFGDAILGLVTVEFLFHKYSDKAEGDLSKLKSNIVSENYLSVKAKTINLGSYIRLGEEEFKSKGYEKKSILANMMESLICSIYLDGGLEAARDFITNFILKGFEKELLSEIHINYKSILQEYCQSKYQKLPDYKTVSAEGPDHKKTFTVVVYLSNEKLGHGIGMTKKAAEQNAAREACHKLGI
ncbi:MAG: ribonuclease III [Candidatus Cloacimonetes bacterium]|nr:ribonuclease III [Candidatus Cloacimonadota bacterium]